MCPQSPRAPCPLTLGQRCSPPAGLTSQKARPVNGVDQQHRVRARLVLSHLQRNTEGTAAHMRRHLDVRAAAGCTSVPAVSHPCLKPRLVLRPEMRHNGPALCSLQRLLGLSMRPAARTAAAPGAYRAPACAG